MARRLSLLTGAGLLFVAGCADDPSLDVDALESGLPAAVVPEDPSVVGEVVCPEPVPETIAQSLTCTASLNGVPITVDVTVDEEATASSRVREPLFELTTVETEAARRIGADLGIGVDVTCPGVVIVFAVDATVDCTAVHDGRPLDFTARIVDEEGNFTFTLAPDAG